MMMAEKPLAANDVNATALTFERATSHEVCSIIITSCHILKQNALALALHNRRYEREQEGGMNGGPVVATDTEERMKIVPIRLLCTMISHLELMPSSEQATSIKSLCRLVSSIIVAECCAAALVQKEEQVRAVANRYIDDAFTCLSTIGKDDSNLFSDNTLITQTIALDSAMEVLALIPLEATYLIRRCNPVKNGSTHLVGISNIGESPGVCDGWNIQVDSEVAVLSLIMTLGKNTHVRGRVMEIVSHSLQNVAAKLSTIASAEQVTSIDRIISGIRALECLQVWIECDVIPTTTPIMGWLDIADIFHSDCIQSILMFSSECFRLLLVSSSSRNCDDCDDTSHRRTLEVLAEAMHVASDVCTNLIDAAKMMIKPSAPLSNDEAQHEAGIAVVMLLCGAAISSYELLVVSPSSVSNSEQNTCSTLASASRQACVGFCCALALVVLEKHGGLLFLDDPRIRTQRAKVPNNGDQNETPHFLGRYIAYIALVVSIREGPLELCAIPAMDLLHYAVATVRDSLAQYLTMCIEQSHIDETANSTEFSKKMHTGMEEVTEMFRSIAPALINAICNRYCKMKLELSCDEQFNADDIDLVSISSEHQHYFMTAAQEALPGIATIGIYLLHLVMSMGGMYQLHEFLFQSLSCFVKKTIQLE
uniref:Uncharacterized protein n=1 Tax=Ditylum brightwellii TaxID=49249 RepID=A0A7S4VSR1_9STRA